MLKLYDYFRSSAAFRVRIALNLKQLDYQSIPIHLLKNGGEQFSAAYRTINPQSRVPTLVDEDVVLYQSLAIIEYLDEKYPQPALLPQNLVQRAHARAIAQIIACDIHQLNNSGTLKYLTHELKISEEQKNTWYHHWIILGFNAIETMLNNSPATGKCCIGDQPTVADICLIPQITNAHRFQCPMNNYPTLNRIFDHCAILPPFKKAFPENQPDAE